MMKLVTFALLLGFTSTAVSDNAVWRECRIDSGRVGTCSKRASGEGVAFQDGAYRECRFVGGKLSSCTRRYSGKLALADDKGVFRECDIRSGRESTCTRRFSGTQYLLSE